MALLFRSSGESVERWKAAFEQHLPDLEFRNYPAMGAPAEIEVAVVWQPPHGLLATLPNLKLIASLGAGLHHLLQPPPLPPHVPILPLLLPYLTPPTTDY